MLFCARVPTAADKHIRPMQRNFGMLMTIDFSEDPNN